MRKKWTQEEAKILAAFLDGERIIRLPAKQKKRLVILRWVLEHIDFVRRYPEAELNAVIGKHHPDFATIRRELYEFGFMDRDHGTYWRIDSPPVDLHLPQD